METIDDFKNTIPQTGKVEWIGISAKRQSPVTELQEATVQVGRGIDGDHHCASGNGEGKRQVTLIQREHLDVVGRILGRDSIAPTLTRRNLVVSGINLIALKERQFRVGEVLLEGSGPCAPCSLMEDNLGAGGYNAMRGHGGITTRVVEGGTIRIGDQVTVVAVTSDE